MAEFGIAIRKLLDLEGGYSNHPNDSGGETIYGITKRDHPDLWVNGPPTKEQCIERYHRDYWQYDHVVDQNAANKIFDMAVNMGPETAIFIIQRSLNLLGWTLRVDGIYGIKTETAVNNTTPSELLHELRTESCVHYALVVLAKPKNKAFVRGWMRRALS